MSTKHYRGKWIYLIWIPFAGIMFIVIIYFINARNIDIVTGQAITTIIIDKIDTELEPVNFYVDDKSQTKMMDCSCINKLYDEIFVISIKSRFKTLAITLYQLNQENINYTIWEGHNPENPYSLQLFEQFKKNIEAANVSKLFWGRRRYSLYHQRNAFMLRQTQVDIFKYVISKGLNKILILEDDITIANAYWLNKFCEMESSISPQWNVLNLGINQGDPDKIKLQLNKQQEGEIAVYRKNEKSWGTFGISLTQEICARFALLFDINSKRINVSPLDNYWYYFKKDKYISLTSYGVHPPLIIPDMISGHSSLQQNSTYGQLQDYLRDRTTDDNTTHFSKYMNLRFSNESSLLQTQILSNTLPFETLIANSPSNFYLQVY